MTEYRVRWEIDVDAAGPVEAARIAQQMQQTTEDYWSGVFTVVDPIGGHDYRVDLNADGYCHAGPW